MRMLRRVLRRRSPIGRREPWCAAWAAAAAFCERFNGVACKGGESHDESEHDEAPNRGAVAVSEVETTDEWQRVEAHEEGGDGACKSASQQAAPGFAVAEGPFAVCVYGAKINGGFPFWQQFRREHGAHVGDERWQKEPQCTEDGFPPWHKCSRGVSALSQPLCTSVAPAAPDAPGDVFVVAVCAFDAGGPNGGDGCVQIVLERFVPVHAEGAFWVHEEAVRDGLFLGFEEAAVGGHLQFVAAVGHAWGVAAFDFHGDDFVVEFDEAIWAAAEAGFGVFHEECVADEVVF